MLDFVNKPDEIDLACHSCHYDAKFLSATVKIYSTLRPYTAIVYDDALIIVFQLTCHRKHIEPFTMFSVY